jgi:hypothetical protein
VALEKTVQLQNVSGRAHIVKLEFSLYIFQRETGTQCCLRNDESQVVEEVNKNRKMQTTRLSAKRRLPEKQDIDAA